MRTRFSRTNCWISYAVRTGWMGTCWTRHDQTWGILAERLRLKSFKQPMGIWLKTWYLVLSEYGPFFLTDWLGKYHILGQTCSGWGWNQQARYYQDTFFDCILNDFGQLTSFIVSLAHNSISQYQTHELHGVTLLVWHKVGSHENHRFSRTHSVNSVFQWHPNRGPSFISGPKSVGESPGSPSRHRNGKTLRSRKAARSGLGETGVDSSPFWVNYTPERPMIQWQKVRGIKMASR